jgi:hypothetical protein
LFRFQELLDTWCQAPLIECKLAAISLLESPLEFV